MAGINNKNCGFPGVLQIMRDKVKSKAIVYGYANARVRAMKANLLSREQMEKILAVDGISSIIGLLEMTNYKQDLVSLSVKYSDEELVERAVGKNFARDARKILRIAPNGAKEIIWAMLQKYDLVNIKTILLGHMLGKEKSKMQEFMVYAGELGERKLNKMIDAKNSAEALLVLHGTVYQRSEEHTSELQSH